MYWKNTTCRMVLKNGFSCQLDLAGNDTNVGLRKSTSTITRITKLDGRIVLQAFRKRISLICCAYGTKKEVMDRCLHARNIRKSQKNMHTAGPKSFARIREEMRNEDPNKEPPTLSQMFERTRKRKEGNVYIDTYDDTARKIEQMKNYKSADDGNTPIDHFHVVMNKEYDGHRRLYGRGVTNKLIKKNGGETSCMVPREHMESLKTIEAKERELVEMRRDFLAECERKKIEQEEDHKKNKEELLAMKDKIVEDALRKLIEKLPPEMARDILP